jgi:hypothetical protein
MHEDHIGKEPTMDLRDTPDLVHLSDAAEDGRWLRLEPARGYRVVAVAGDVWITQAGHIEDYVLHPGQALALDSPGAAIVSAFGRADVEVIAPPAPPGPDPLPIVTAQVLERAQREARRLRAQAVHDMFAAAAGWVRARVHRLGALVDRLAAPSRGHRHC